MRLLRILVCAMVCSAVALAQTAVEVTSVKPSQPGTNGRSLTQLSGAGLMTSGATAKMLIMLAYQVMPYQIVGGADWLGSEGFDIEAKATDSKSTPVQFREMLKALLEDRFHLKVHTATKELPIWVLARASGGPKLREAIGDEQDTGVRIQGAGQVTGVKATMPALANVLTKPLQRKVVDETGLTGSYNFTLRYAPDLGLSPANAGAVSDLPSIFTALQEQLGLTLRDSKGPVEVLVIDSAKKPSAN